MQTAPGEAPGATAIGKDGCLSNRLEEEKARALAGQQYEVQQHICVHDQKDQAEDSAVPNEELSI